MGQKKKGKSLSRAVSVFIALGVCTGCELGDSDIAGVLAKMRQRKQNVELHLTSGGGDSQEIRKYFDSFERLVEAMRASRRTTGKKLSYIGYFGPDAICADLFLAPGLYRTALDHCSKSTAFETRIPCQSPSWRRYQNHVQRWAELLDERTAQVIWSSAVCRERLSALGVDL